MTHPVTTTDPAARAARILAGVPADGLFAAGQTGGAPCRIGPDPFPLPPALLATLERQGVLWLNFLRAAHRIYLKSHGGDAPAWIAAYLDAGKPARLLEFARMNRFKSQVPMVIRPDLLLTDAGPVACELDSVPGGIGLLGCLSRLYEREGIACAGGPDGMVRGFRDALSHLAGASDPATAIVVSDESKMYAPEMRWLAEALAALGAPARILPPGAFNEAGAGFAVVYRFFELFDLPNIPGAEAILDAARLKKIRLTPPPKPQLEEKLLFALLHHPALAPLWDAELGEAAAGALRELVIPTWVLDPRPLPPHAAIAGLTVSGRTIQSWDALAALSQKDRALVIKPSGFGEDAWGSHGVRFGADMPQEEWKAVVAEALAAFPDRPRVLQPYRKPALHTVPYLEPATWTIRDLAGRVRLTPYYFVTGDDDARLGGILATVCPADKKAIHGMPDAVMLPVGGFPAAGKMPAVGNP